MTPCGFLNIDKPTGMTSRDVVNRVQRLGRGVKAGHAGTLDPLASGVLVVCLGAATRLARYVQAMRKHYRATFLLGRESPTEDVEGPITPWDDAAVPTVDQLRAAAAALTGEIQQRPPAFSALKVRGRRAYDLARAGEAVDLQPRPVTIYRLEIQRYDYPELDLWIECSSGTYVRCLGRDLAASVGTAAVMARLTRTAVGSFRIEDATPLDRLGPADWLDSLAPPLRAVETLPRMTLTREELRRLQWGQAIVRDASAPVGTEVAGIDPDGQLAAILSPRGGGRWGAVWQAGHPPSATNR